MDIDFDMQLDADPAPRPEKKPVGRPPKAGSKPPGRPSAASKQKELTQELQGMIFLLAMPISIRDPECGKALLTQSTDIAEAVADIAMDHAWLLKWLQAGGSSAKYIKLVMALMPVGQQVYYHHFVARETLVESGDPADYIGGHRGG